MDTIGDTAAHTAAPGDSAAAEGATDPDIVRVALDGLLASRKTLPPSLFYDAEGCRLFYKIVELPEYYLTRTEAVLLREAAPAVAARTPPGATLVEYGASDETKAETLLRQTAADGTAVFRTYIPIDVAAGALESMRRRLARRSPDLLVLPVEADFLRPVRLPARPGETAVLGFFPGSTIGNLEPAAAESFLRRAREALGRDGRLLLGFDTTRDPDRLIPAYDDPMGVTAAFNRNLLARLNREAGADFDLGSFAHRTVWNAAESRIEMHLVSRAAQTATVGGQRVRFAQGETIHTENSYKYAPNRMRAMARSAGWSPRETWTGPNESFALWLLG